MSPIGRLLALLAGFLVVVSALIPWVDVGASGQVSAIDVASGWAVGINIDRLTNTWPESLFVPVVLGAVLILVGAVIRSSAVTAIGSIGVLAIVVLWFIAENRDRFGGSLTLTSFSNVTLNSTVGPGPVLALVGGVLGLVCALVLRDRKSNILPTDI